LQDALRNAGMPATPAAGGRLATARLAPAAPAAPMQHRRILMRLNDQRQSRTCCQACMWARRQTSDMEAVRLGMDRINGAPTRE
jgi:hypothetical protein